MKVTIRASRGRGRGFHNNIKSKAVNQMHEGVASEEEEEDECCALGWCEGGNHRTPNAR